MDKKTYERLMSGYIDWKPWSREIAPTFQYSVFAEEIARANVPEGARILEIGFGEGSFLDWARANGFDCAGLEINPKLVESSRARGLEVYQGTLSDAFPSGEHLFDVVVLFDVLEHIQLDDIVDLLDGLEKLLSVEGQVIARFPNGASPFGRAYQYGDATHVSVLTGSSMTQIGAATGFEQIRYYNAARGKKSRDGGIRNLWLIRQAAFLLRNFFQVIIGLIYFGKNIPMDPNITVIMRKKKS